MVKLYRLYLHVAENLPLWSSPDLTWIFHDPNMYNMEDTNVNMTSDHIQEDC